MTFAEAWSIYAPLAVYQLVGWAILSLVIEALSPVTSRALLALAFAVVFVLLLLFWVAIAVKLRSALRFGVMATAVVVQAGAPMTSPRVAINGRETVLRSSSSRRLGLGDRITVLTNSAGDKVLLSLA